VGEQDLRPLASRSAAQAGHVHLRAWAAPSGARSPTAHRPGAPRTPPGGREQQEGEDARSRLPSQVRLTPPSSRISRGPRNAEPPSLETSFAGSPETVA